MHTAEALAELISSFLATAPAGAVLEDGAELFDLQHARWSATADRGRCLLHLWSDERSLVRRVVDAERKHGSLRLVTQRFGHAKPTRLEIALSRDRGTESVRRTVRRGYETALARILQNRFPEFQIATLTSKPDLRHSFSPVYARGILQRGQSAFAVLGVNAQELQSSVDGALTFGLIWFQHCRRLMQLQCVIEGLRLFVPAGMSALLAERMALLDRSLAKYELFEVNEAEGTLRSIDVDDRGNLATHLVHCPDRAAAEERFAHSIAFMRSTAAEIRAEVEIAVRSAAEVAFSIRGLEFARVRSGGGDSFRLSEQLTFGIGGEETPLTPETEQRFRMLLQRICRERSIAGDRSSPLYRMQPERWLETIVCENVSAVDSQFAAAPVYSQVPAFSARPGSPVRAGFARAGVGDRGMIDVLTATQAGRLAVLELKADEDIHLPLQGLDYWARVAWHNARGEFQRFGYFPGVQLAPEPPLLYLIAPALRIHPETDTLLRYLSPEIAWTLVGVDEKWREGVRVIFRKRREIGRAASL